MKSLHLAIGILLFVFGAPLAAYGAVASSTNYQLERDSINIGGAFSTSTNSHLEDTAGEFVSGTSSSASYFLKAGYQQTESSYITISSPADVTLSPNISQDTGGAANGSAIWTVTTNSSTGYTLSIRAQTSPAMQSSSASFNDYAPASTDPDYTWAVGASSRAFGYTPESTSLATRYKDNGTSCNISGGSDTTGACWDGLSTSNRVVTQSGSPTVSGTDTTVRFRAEAGSANNPPPGSYTATVILTAITQ